MSYYIVLDLAGDAINWGNVCATYLVAHVTIICRTFYIDIFLGRLKE